MCQMLCWLGGAQGAPEHRLGPQGTSSTILQVQLSLPDYLMVLQMPTRSVHEKAVKALRREVCCVGLGCRWRSGESSQRYLCRHEVCNVAEGGAGGRRVRMWGRIMVWVSFLFCLVSDRQEMDLVGLSSFLFSSSHHLWFDLLLPSLDILVPVREFLNFHSLAEPRVSHRFAGTGWHSMLPELMGLPNPVEI